MKKITVFALLILLPTFISFIPHFLFPRRHTKSNVKGDYRETKDDVSNKKLHKGKMDMKARAEKQREKKTREWAETQELSRKRKKAKPKKEAFSRSVNNTTINHP